MFCATLMSALSLIASVCVLCLMRRSVIHRPSRRLRSFMSCLARVFCVKHERSSAETAEQYKSVNEEENKLLVMTTLNSKMLTSNDSQNADNQPDVQKNTFTAVDGERRNDVVVMLERIRREVAINNYV